MEETRDKRRAFTLTQQKNILMLKDRGKGEQE